MIGSHKKLTRDDRKCIETMIYDGKTIQEIADRVGVHRTTIDHKLNDIVLEIYSMISNIDFITKLKKMNSREEFLRALGVS